MRPAISNEINTQSKQEMALAAVDPGPSILSLPDEILLIVFSAFYETFDLELDRRPDRSLKLKSSPLNLALTCRRFSRIALPVLQYHLPTHLEADHFYNDTRGYPAAFYDNQKFQWLHHHIKSISISFPMVLNDDSFVDGWAKLIHACPRLETLDLKYVYSPLDEDLEDITSPDFTTACDVATKHFIQSGQLWLFSAVVKHWDSIFYGCLSHLMGELGEISNFMHVRNQWDYHHRELTQAEEEHGEKGNDVINFVLEIQIRETDGDASRVVLRDARTMRNWTERELWSEVEYDGRRAVWKHGSDGEPDTFHASAIDGCRDEFEV